MIKTNNLNDNRIDLSKELVMLDNVNLPFTSLLLRKGTDKCGDIITSWQYETLDSSRGTSKEGADITDFQTSDRSTGDKNICQIIRKAVSVSGTAGAIQLNNISDLFTHELQNRMLEAKRDLEYYLINGKYQEETADKAREMKGLLEFIKDENKLSGQTITKSDLNEIAKKMQKAGTASQNLILLCDYNTMDLIQDLYDDKIRYIGVTNEFGCPVLKINMTYASAIVYLCDSLPVNTMALVNLDYLKMAELRPLMYEDLAKTGDSRKGFICMENTLKVLHPDFAVQFTLEETQG
ncbi:SU10 major capsid protein [Clostridium ganghwense]|uniref:DUF5309 family protein n=1 Tax=Clostridium ganghwense TaxID=312089 RepID=A0ABT4CX56_9CLOT|nr:DUF5309 family protein [Clostridium ganghwense]MCY6372761.1 DUF5309 family protein [Clostridium ganghwense]